MSLVKVEGSMGLLQVHETLGATASHCSGLELNRVQSQLRNHDVNDSLQSELASVSESNQ